MTNDGGMAVEEVTGKAWWESKTVWFNVATLVIAVVMAVLTFFGYEGFEPTGEWAQIIPLVVAIVNLVLRMVTREPIRGIGRMTNDE